MRFKTVVSKATVQRQFIQRFEDLPSVVVRAPGRVNLIGEHTDYNDGFVLPMAIGQAIWLAVRPRTDRRVLLHFLDFDTRVDFPLDAVVSGVPGPAEYVKGMAWALQEAGYALTGFEGVVQGDIPIGAGLSSSAALEVAVARTFAALSGLEWQPLAMARLAQRAENEWVGVNCGIMDQLVSAMAKAGHALLIDCRSLETVAVSLPAGVSVVVMDTGTRRELGDSPYNERRAQCETAARLLGVPALRDASLSMLQAHASEMETVIYRRARHVILENQRTLAAREAMCHQDIQTLGDLLRDSHTSLRDDFQVSSGPLDCIVTVALEHPACYGARMTGAGIGGCAVALVSDDLEGFMDHVEQHYQQQSGIAPRLYVCEAADGASVVE